MDDLDELAAHLRDAGDLPAERQPERQHQLVRRFGHMANGGRWLGWQCEQCGGWWTREPTASCPQEQEAERHGG